MLTVISLGAGVQSSTLALMAAHGEITPMPDAAIFADTQAEPLAVYTWLDWLEMEIDRAIRHGVADRTNGKPLSPAKWYVHRSCRPLDKVEFGDDPRQINLFEDECEGVCGV